MSARQVRNAIAVPLRAPGISLSQIADVRSLEWQERAACAEVDVNMFFPEKGQSVSDPKRICRGCEVREQCLEYALTFGDSLHGVWGGMSDLERRKLRQQRAAGTAEAVAA